MMSVNLKAIKHLFDRKLRLAVFVNKIFDYLGLEQFGCSHPQEPISILRYGNQL